MDAPILPPASRVICPSCRGETFTIFLETASINLVCSNCKTPMSIQSLLGAIDKKIIGKIVSNLFFGKMAR